MTAPIGCFVVLGAQSTMADVVVGYDAATDMLTISITDTSRRVRMSLGFPRGGQGDRLLKEIEAVMKR